jgi:hypothetical protein
MLVHVLLCKMLVKGGRCGINGFHHFTKWMTRNASSNSSLGNASLQHMTPD